MEILAEILFQVLGWLLEIAGEFLLQIAFEGIADLIGHGAKAGSRQRSGKPMHPPLVAAGYVLLGAAAGAASLWLLPGLFIKSDGLRFANLIITPLLSGAVMAWMGSWRRRHDKNTLRIETFTYGYCFAFSMAVVRFVWGHA